MESSWPMGTKQSRSRDTLTLNRVICFGPLLLHSYKFRHRPYRTLPRNHYPPASTPFTTTSPWPTTGLSRTEPPPLPKVPCPKLLQRLSGDQRTSFLRLWDRLPLHLRDITFDLHGSGWSPSVIEDLGHVLCEFADVFSTSKTDIGSCSLITFKISIPPDSAPVFSHPYRINHILAKKIDAVLD